MPNSVSASAAWGRVHQQHPADSTHPPPALYQLSWWHEWEGGTAPCKSHHQPYQSQLHQHGQDTASASRDKRPSWSCGKGRLPGDSPRAARGGWDLLGPFGLPAARVSSSSELAQDARANTVRLSAEPLLWSWGMARVASEGSESRNSSPSKQAVRTRAGQVTRWRWQLAPGA